MPRKPSASTRTEQSDSGNNSPSRLSRLTRNRNKSRPELSDLEPKALTLMMDAVIESGALISFSRTSDGGALCVYVKDDRDVDQQYFGHLEELVDYIAELHALFE